eukprot:TRINITY_DN1501_c0_g1_i4.p1 TRINITY_DN1501_c0_g1~~TRINITY_DN1501_c0_g1_i4.p1  ORF type:complete len:503 (-),score=106.47 TRINITY_DN1501_c0_g1_i4:259-1767(-)
MLHAAFDSSSHTTALVSLLTSVFVVLTCGSLYGFSAYSKELASILGEQSVDLLGSAGDLGVYTGILMGICFGRFGSAITTVISTILVGGGYFMCYLLLPLKPPVIVLGLFYYCVGQGSFGLFFVCLSINSSNYPLKHRGKVVGLVQSLFGGSSILFTLVYLHLLGSSVRSYFLLVSLSTTAAGILCFLLIKQNQTNKEEEKSEPAPELESPLEASTGSYVPIQDDHKASTSSPICQAQTPEQGIVPSRVSDPDPLHPRHRGTSAVEVNLTGLQLFRLSEFWLMWGNFLLVSGCGLMWKNILGSVVPALMHGSADELSSNLVMAWSASTALSRVLSGALCDLLVHRVSRPFWLVIGAFAFFVGHLSFALYPNQGTLWLADLLTAIGYGIAFSIVATLTSIYFGVKSLGFNIGLMNLAPAIGGSLFTFLSTRFVAWSTPAGASSCSGSSCYTSTFIFSSVLCAVATVMAWLLTRRYPPRWFLTPAKLKHHPCHTEKQPLTNADG